MPRKRADGRYCSQIYIGRDEKGRKKYKTVYAKSPAELKEKETDVRRQLGLGIDLLSSRDTFAKWADDFLRLKSRPNIRFAGQITGCEGYIESACVGWLAGYFAAAEILGLTPHLPPETTAFGAMYKHLRDDTNIDDFQPMNINFGIFPTISGERTANGKFRKIKGMDRKKAYSIRALEAINNWINEINKP